MKVKVGSRVRVNRQDPPLIGEGRVAAIFGRLIVVEIDGVYRNLYEEEVTDEIKRDG